MQNGLSGEDQLNDAELVIRARGRDAAAWEALVRHHQDSVFRLAYLLLGDPDDAEDTAQEAFLRAYHALERFDTSRPLRPWLLRIAANLARNRRRALGRYWAALQRAARLDPDSGKAVEHGQDDAEELWRAVRRLGEADQEIIYLRYFLDMPEAQMAQTLEVPPGTVKSRLHRALGRLRGVVEKDFPGLREGFAE